MSEKSSAGPYGDNDKIEVVHVDEKIGDNTAEAMEAEAAEHNMGLLEAVRAYPMACFWAFVMSFTIVSVFWCSGLGVFFSGLLTPPR
jgi:SP family general alpha glucoside:H+ symporter-like MFS transporter